MKIQSNPFLRLSVVALLGLGAAQATTYSWTGTTNGNMSGTTANWGGTVPTAADIAQWNSASYTNAPTVNADMTLGELFFTALNTGGTTFGSGTSILTLNGVGGIGIQLDSGSGAVNTSNANFKIGASQSWINNSASTLTVGGTITNSGNASPYALTLSGSGITTLTGIISNGGTTGTLALTKSGAGTLTISGANTYTGGTTISAGTLKVGNAVALGGNARAVSVAATGAALDLNGITMTGTNALTLNGTGISSGGALINNNSAAAGTYLGTVAMATDSSIGGNGAGVTLSGIVSGAFNLTKVGSNMLILSNTANTFGGAGKTFAISAGTVQLGAVTTSLGAANTAVTVSNGASLDLNGKAYTTTTPLTINGQYSSTVGALGNGSATAVTFTNTVAMATDSSIGGNGAGALTLSQIVSGAFNLTKVGTGTLVLSNAANTFGGAGKTFAINAGTVQLGAVTTSLGAAGTAVTVSSGAVLNLNGKVYTTNNPLTINGSGIGGTGAIMNSGSTSSYSSDVTLASDSTIGIIAGAGALTLSGNLTSTGTQNLTLINSSGVSLTLANVNNTGTVTNSGSGGAATIITTLGSNVTGLTEAGATPFTVTNAVGLTASLNSFTSTGAGLFTLSGQLTGAQTLTLSANSTGGITLTAGANNGGSIINNGSGTNTVTVGPIGALVTTGVTQNAVNSILLLNGAGLYTGGTTITAGTLKIGNATALGASSSAVSVATGAVLDLNGQTITNTNALTLNGTGSSSGGALTNSSATAGTYAGTVALGSASNIGGTGNITLSSAVSGGSALTKVGADTLILSGTNSYSGATTVSAGTLKFAKLVSLYNNTPASWTAANIIVANTGTLAVNVGGTGEFATGDVTTLLANLGGANGTSSTGFAAGSAIGFDTTNASGSTFTVADTLADSTGTGGGALGVTKLGANTLVLTGPNTYTGPTTISAGTLKVGNTTALSTGAVSVTATAAALDLNGTTVTNTNALTLNGTGVSSGGALTNSNASAASYAGTVALGSASSIGGSNGTLTLNGIVSGAFNLAKVGSDTLTLSAANTYSGNTLVSAGVLALGNNLALQNSAIDTSGAGTITLSATTPTIGGLVGSTALATVFTTGYSAVTNLTLNNSGSNSYSGAIANGTMALTKTGAGTQTLSGTNTYTGTTTVSAGTLQFGKTASLYNSLTGSWTAANLIVANTGTLALNVGGSGEFTTGNVTALLANLGGANGTATTGFAAGSSIGFDTTNASGSTFTVADILADSTGTGGGTLGVIKLGANTLVLTGTSTYTGPTTLSAGTLQIGNGTDAGSINSTSGIIDNGVLAFNVGTGNRTVAVPVSGTGSITQNGTGTLALSAANSSFTGSVTLNTGTLALNHAAALGTSAGTFVINGGTLDNTSAAAITLTSNKPVTLNADFAFTGSKDLNLGTGAVSLGAAAGSSRTITANGGTLTLGGLISAGTTANSIIKAGTGALTLAGANNFTGGVTLNAGTLNINSVNALGTASSTFVIAAGTTIGNTSGTAITTTANPQTWNGDFSFTGAGLSTALFDLSMGTGAVTLGSTAGTSRTITVNSGTLAEGGVIANGTTANSLIKAGAGTLTLAGANTFTGGVTLNAGTLYLTAAAALGTGTFTINGGALTGYGGASGSVLTTTNNVQVWNGDFAFSTSPLVMAINVGSGYNDQNLNLGTGTVTLGGTGTSRTITSNGYYSNLIVGGIISNGGTANSLTKAGTGILTLSGANAFTGGVTLNAGTLSLGNAAALGTLASTLTLNGGSLALGVNLSANTTLNNNAQVWNGAFSFRPTTSNTLALNMGTGAVTLAGNSTVTAVAGGLTEGGNIGDSGLNYGVTWVAGYANNISTVISLTGTSTYHGATVVQSLNGLGNVTMATGSLANTSGVTVSGGGKLIVGTTGAGVSNRINSAATLTLGGQGGGFFQLVGSTNATVNAQTFASLNIGAGPNVLYTDQTTNISQITFSGANPYIRSVGGTLRYLELAGSFSSAPSGTGNVIGSGSNAMLVGATYAATSTSTDATYFVKAASGTVSNITGSSDIYGSGVNTDLGLGSNVVPTTGVTQSIRFNGTATLTLPGAFTVESGGILANQNTATLSRITGGTLSTGLSGGDLWVVQGGQSGAGTGVIIGSQIIDNGGSSLTKGGVRALYLANTNNTYAGGTYLGEGTLNVASAGSLGSGALNFTGNATLQAAGNVALGSRAVTIGQGVIATFDTNGNAITVGGVLSGTNSGLTKTGLGTLTLSGANTYTGVTALQNGTLKLDFSASGAPTSNIINSNSLLSLGIAGTYNQSIVGALSETLLIQGAANTANTQTFGATNSPLGQNGSTTFSGGGMTNMVFNAGASGSLTVNLGNIARGGSAFFDVTTSGNVTVGGVDPGTMLSGAGYLLSSFWAGGGNNSAWVTVNKSTWATVTAAGNLVGIADSAYTKNTGGVIATNTMADIVTSGTLTVASNSAQTLRFNDTLGTGAGQTLTLSGAGVTQLSMGAILVTANAGAHDSTITGGFLTGANLSSFAFFQNNTLGNLVINSQITDQGQSASFTKNGAGTVILNGVNTNSGLVIVNEGAVIATGDFMPGSVKTITTTAGSNVVAMSDTSNLFVGQALVSIAGYLNVTNGSRPNIVTAINPGVSVTLSNTATGTGSLTGTFTTGGALGGYNSTAGATTAYIANGATLQIGSAATGNHGAIDPSMQITNQGALILNHSGAYTFGNVLSGTVATNSLAGTVGMNTLEVTGGGTTTLGFSGIVNGSGVGGQQLYTLSTTGNVYAGQGVTGTNIPGGTVVSWVDGLTVKFSNAISAGGASNLTFQTINSFNGTTRITGGSTLTLGSQLALQNSTLLYNTADTGTFSFGTFTTATLGGLAGDRNLPLTNASSAAVALTVGGNNFDTTYSGNLTGTGSSLAKTGIGTLTLTGTNSYTGGTTIAAGGTLKGNTASLQGNITNNSGTVAFDQATTGTYAGNISGTTGSIVKTGAGTLTLSGVQGISSSLIDVQAGTLALGVSSLFANSNSLRISGGTLDIGGNNDQLKDMVMSSGTITGSGFLQVLSTYNFTDSGTVNSRLRNGIASLIKSGAGTVELSAAGSDYAGATTLNGGTLLVSGTLTATVSVNVAAGTLQIGNGGTTGSLNTAAAITDNGNLTINRNNAVAQGTDFSAAAITGTGSFTQAGTGTTTLNAANTYTGATTVTAGTLKVDGSTAAGSALAIGTAGTLSGTGTINGNATLTGSGVINKASGTMVGTLAVTGGSWNNLGAVTGVVTSSSGIFTIGAGANLTANGGLNVTGGGIAAGNSSSTITGSVNYTSSTGSSYGGVIAGSGKTLTLNSASTTLELLGTNTYTGETTVAAGKLVVNGNISTSTLTTVNSGASLGGSGTVGAAAISGSLAPGNSIGTITATGNVTWNANDAWVFELGSAASSLALASSGSSIQDLLNITGAGNALLKGTGSVFTFDFAGTGTTGWYKVVDYTGTSTFSNSDFAATGLTGTLTGTFTVDSATSAIYLNVVPEPATTLLGGLGALALLRRRRVA